MFTMDNSTGWKSGIGFLFDYCRQQTTAVSMKLAMITTYKRSVKLLPSYQWNSISSLPEFHCQINCIFHWKTYQNLTIVRNQRPHRPHHRLQHRVAVTQFIFRRNRKRQRSPWPKTPLGYSNESIRRITQTTNQEKPQTRSKFLDLCTSTCTWL